MEVKKVKLVSEKSLGIQPVGDISIEHEDHLYLLDSAIVHNCPGTCFPLEGPTFITTPEGDLNLGVVIKEKIKTKVLNHKDQFIEIFNHFINGFKQLFEYEDEDGVIYQCTEDHKFITYLNGELIELPISEIFNLDLPILKKL